MIGIMLEHDFMIKQSICDTFVLVKLDFSGSDQVLLNTLLYKKKGHHYKKKGHFS